MAFLGCFYPQQKKLNSGAVAFDFCKKSKQAIYD